MVLRLNASLVDAYRRYILDGGLLNVEVRPDRDIDYSSLSLFSANDIVSMLNLRITLNGQLLKDLTLDVDTKQFAGAIQQAEPEHLNEDNVATEQTEPLVLEKSYQDTELEVADTFLKRRAIVELDSGKTVEGVIILVDEHIIEIEQIVTGGKVSYPLRKRNIISFKVWR